MSPFKTTYKLYIGTIFIFMASPALAAKPDSIINDTSGLITAVAKVSGALAIVVALMLILLYAIKKLGLGNGTIKGNSRITIIETRMVAPKKYIAIAQIAGKHMALGITDHNINLLTHLDEQDMSLSSTTSHTSRKISFAGVLQKTASCIKGQTATTKSM